MKNAKYIIGLFLVVSFVFLIGCTQTANVVKEQAKEPIKVGFISCLTGDAAIIGAEEKNGVELAVEEINKAGGVNGRLLQIIYEDGKCNGKEAATVTQKLVNIDGVKAILGGGCSSETLGAAPITEENKVILLSAFSSSPDITNAGDYVFRTCPADTDPKVIGGLIPYIAENKRIAIISENSDYSVGIKQGLKEQLASYNTEIVSDELFTPGEKDFRTYLTKIKGKNPDALFVNVATSASAAGMIVKQASDLGLNAKLYGNFVLIGPEAIEQAGQLLEGAMAFDAPLLDSSNPKAASFMANYKAKYGEPFSFWDAGARYDTVYILKNALEACGEDTDCIKNYFYNMDWYTGTIGKIKFDENGDVIGIEGAVKTLVDGKPVVINEKTQKQNLKIGVILPLTGNSAVYGEWTKKGFDLAVKEINALPDYPYNLELVYEDDEGTPKGAVSAFQKIMIEHNPSVVIGFPLSKELISVAPIAENNKIVVFSPSASSDSLRTAGDYVFRLRESGSLHGIATAEYLANKGIMDYVGVLYLNAENGITYEQSFSKRYQELGGSIVFKETYEEGETDFKTYLIKAKEKGVKTLYAPGVVADIGMMMKQANELGLNIDFYSTPGAESSKLIEIAGKAAEGLIYTYPVFNPESSQPEVKAFVQSYEKEYGTTPEFIAANSFDMIKILARIFRENGMSSDEIRSGLYSVKNYNGASGQLSITEYRDVIRPIGFKTVKNGEFVVVDN